MSASPPWAPAPEAVAPHLRQFLRGGGGSAQRETFDQTTTIRLSEAEQAIASVTADVAAAVGDDASAGWFLDPPQARLSPLLWDQARAVTAIGAAAEAIVDRSGTGDLYERLWRLFEARLKRLVTASVDVRDGTVDGHTAIPATWSGPDPFPVDRTAW